MKITIELDVSREDIPASVELFAIIRKFADSVKFKNASSLLAELIPRLENPSEAESVTNDILRVLETSSNVEEVLPVFSSTFTQFALALDLVPRGGTTMPFLSILPRLPEPFRSKMKTEVAMKIVQFLNASRPVDCNRLEILTYADAFATLVKLDYVKISGAINTINALLKKQDQKSAALTMLGKTVELCINQIKEKCDPAPLNELRMLLQSPSVNTEPFAYDISYVESCLGWTRRPEPFSPPNGVPAAPNGSYSNAYASVTSTNYPSPASNGFSSPAPNTFSTPPSAFTTPLPATPSTTSPNGFGSVPPNGFAPAPSNGFASPSSNSYNSNNAPSPQTSANNNNAPPTNTFNPHPVSNSFSSPASNFNSVNSFFVPPSSTFAQPGSIPVSSVSLVSALNNPSSSANPPLAGSSSQLSLGNPPTVVSVTKPLQSSASSQSINSSNNSSGLRNESSTNITQEKPGLSLKNRHVGHTNTIFAITYDEVNDNAISTGKDCVIIVWGKEGKQKERLTIPRHYACSMEINQRAKSLYICGVSKENDPNPGLVRYAINDRGNWSLTGIAEKKSSKLISCVKTLRSDKDLFITGETDKIRDTVGYVRLYDFTNRTTFENITPILSFEEHHDIVTSLTPHPTADELFFSGSRDQAIKMWDRRTRKSSATFGVANSAGAVIAHEGMITCLDAYGYKLVSGGLDKRVALWDLRAISSNNGFTHAVSRWEVDGKALLKVAIGPDHNTAATSTLQRLYLLDLTTGKYVAADASPHNGAGRYHDLKWSASKVLHAVGDDCVLDEYIIK